jgi:hypothetical protein
MPHVIRMPIPSPWIDSANLAETPSRYMVFLYFFGPFGSSSMPFGPGTYTRVLARTGLTAHHFSNWRLAYSVYRTQRAVETQ